MLDNFEHRQKRQGPAFFLLTVVLTLLGGCHVDDDDNDSQPTVTEILDPLADIRSNNGQYTPECTYCGDNTLVGGGDSVLIDHIFTKNLTTNISEMRPEILFKETVMLANGEISTLSDHFGVKLTLPNLELSSFNVGLAHGLVPYAEERVAKIQETLESYSSDVICLQEVWLESDTDVIQTALMSGGFSYIYQLEEEDEIVPAACNAEEIQPLLSCANINCGSVTGAALTDCSLNQCAAEFAALNASNPACVGAIAVQVGTVSLNTIEEVVTQPTSKYAYSGRNGLILASNRELFNKDYLSLDATNIRRTVLYATVFDDAGVENHLFCTHLTADISNTPYPGEFESWENEQALQIDALKNFVSQKAGNVPQILLGDFNFGKADVERDIDAELPDNYDRFLQ